MHDGLPSTLQPNKVYRARILHGYGPYLHGRIPSALLPNTCILLLFTRQKSVCLIAEYAYHALVYTAEVRLPDCGTRVSCCYLHGRSPSAWLRNTCILLLFTRQKSVHLIAEHVYLALIYTAEVRQPDCGTRHAPHLRLTSWAVIGFHPVP